VTTPEMRIGLGFDVHAFGGDRPLVLGGVTIPSAPGLSGHSDADVVSHAVADAMLAAAGLPDIGTLFPATDVTYRDASSLTFVNAATARLTEGGYSVQNVSVVVAAEQPALAAHIDAMTSRLSECAGAPVSVTPKRGEGVGAVGRGEGIAAWAVALLARESSSAT
jgi:2-C-methyl-D-erythritol 2,4-cyclodiphosphate synthase